MSDVTLTIDGKSVTVPQNTTLLEAAQKAGSQVPTICYHQACTANAVCRMCVVEVQGARVLAPACASQANEGMVVQTQSERVRRARRTILEMLNSTIDLSEALEVQAQMAEYAAQVDRFPGAEQRQPALIDDNPMYVRDYAKCVLCWRCVQVCAEDAQYTYAINFAGRGFETLIGTFADKALPATTCVFCGQCVGVCPTGALKPKRLWLYEQGLSPEEIVQTVRPGRKKSKAQGGER